MSPIRVNLDSQPRQHTADMPQPASRQQPPKHRGPPWGPTQHAAALQEVIRRSFESLYEESSRYIPQPKLQSAHRATQQRFDIKTGAVLNSLGQPVPSTGYMEPISPKMMQTWLSQSQPWKVCQDFVPNIYDCSQPMSYALRQYEADDIISILKGYLEGNQTDGMPGIMETHTAWMSGLVSSSNFVNRLEQDNADWQLKAVYRQCNKSSATPQSEPMLNPDKPHALAFMADGAPLQEWVVSTSELATIMYTAGDNSIRQEYPKHRFFPLTLLTASDTQVRLSQSTYDVQNGTIGVRLSQIYDLKGGLQKNLATVYALLGYIAGKPIGNTIW